MRKVKLINTTINLDVPRDSEAHPYNTLVLELTTLVSKLLVENENLELVMDGLEFERDALRVKVRELDFDLDNEQCENDGFRDEVVELDNLRIEVEKVATERNNLAEENENFANYLENHEFTPCEIDNIAGGWMV